MGKMDSGVGGTWAEPPGKGKVAPVERGTWAALGGRIEVQCRVGRCRAEDGRGKAEEVLKRLSLFAGRSFQDGEALAEFGNLHEHVAEEDAAHRSGCGGGGCRRGFGG